MPADYAASRERDRRFERRFLFVLASLVLIVHALGVLLAAAAGRWTLLGGCFTLDAVVLIVAGLAWLSGKIFR